MAGQAKILGTSDNKKTGAEQILHKLAITETRPEGRHQTGAGKSKKAERTTTTQDQKTDTGDADDVIITHDGTKQTHLESTHPSTKGRHTTEPKPVTVNKGTGKITQVSLKRSTDAAQPPLPLHVNKYCNYLL